MIKFVVQKPVKKIIRNYVPIESNQKKRKIWFHFFSIKTIWIVFGLFATIYWCFFFLKNSIFNHQYTIKRVVYNTGNILWYDDPYLYKRINTWIKWENYSVVKRYTSRILEDIQAMYPMVSDIEVTYISSNTVFITLVFSPISLIIRNQNTRFGLIKDVIFPIYSGNKIANDIRILDLPSYMSGVTTLSWLFFRQSATWLIQQIDLLYQWFPWLGSGENHIEYLPWWERSIVYIEKKRFYINNLGDIPNQIRNYQLLKKYYKEYAQLQDIDLWSLEKDKVIVRKF